MAALEQLPYALVDGSSWLDDFDKWLKKTVDDDEVDVDASARNKIRSNYERKKMLKINKMMI